jgi:NAD-dependent deacetylase
MRPHIVWFGEMPLQMDDIHDLAEQSALFVAIGTSGEVYPAAGFVTMFKDMRKPTVELNLEPSRNQDQFDFAIHKPATVAVEEFKNLLIKNILEAFLLYLRLNFSILPAVSPNVRCPV